MGLQRVQPLSWMAVWQKDQKKSCKRNRLQDFFVAPRVGLEPTTARLTAACSTDWAIEDYNKNTVLSLDYVSGTFFSTFKTAYSFFYPTKLNLFLVLRHYNHLRSYARMFLPFRGHSYARYAHIFMLSRSNAIMFPIRLLKVNFHRRLVIHDTSSLLWSSPRPISDSQLHVLPHFHLCPIYLVVFKGSYWINSRDILS